MSPSKVVPCPNCTVPHREVGGLAEVMAVCDVSQVRSVSQWRAGKNLAGRGPFPEPFRLILAGPLWDLRAVRAWTKKKGPGRAKT